MVKVEMVARRREGAGERYEGSRCGVYGGSGGVLGRMGRKKKFERVICLSVPRAPPTPRCFASTLAVPRGLKREGTREWGMQVEWRCEGEYGAVVKVEMVEMVELVWAGCRGRHPLRRL